MADFSRGRRGNTTAKQLLLFFENDGTGKPPQLCISQIAVQEVSSKSGKFLQPTSSDQGYDVLDIPISLTLTFK